MGKTGFLGLAHAISDETRKLEVPLPYNYADYGSLDPAIQR